MDRTKNSSAFRYKDGEFFRTAPVGHPEEYLTAAEDAEKYIRTFQTEDKDGIYWNELPDPASLTFYRGSAGILLFYSQLYRINPEPRLLNIIKSASSRLVSRWRDLLNAKEEIAPGTSVGLYMGIAGIGLALTGVHDLIPETAEKGIRDISLHYLNSASRSAAGVYWSDNAPIYMDGGAALFLLRASEILAPSDPDLAEKLKELAESAASHILSFGTRYPGHALEIDHTKLSFKHKEPNFEFGTAGDGYLFAKVYESTGNSRFLEAAKACERYLSKIRVPQGSGFLIPYKLTMNPPIFYLGSCHGPAGTGKFYYELYQQTGDPYYLSEMEELIQGLESLGAPRKMSPGYWNTLCLCCGPAGLLEMYIGAYLAAGNPHYREKATEAGSILMAYREPAPEGGSRWPLAFNRTEPDALTSPIGYMNGACGIASSLLQLYLLEKNDFHWTRLIDDPFPENL